MFRVFAVTCAMLPLLRRAAVGRIVNLSSEMGSMTRRSDPTLKVAQYPPSLAYDASKTAVNSLTVSFARELRDPCRVRNAPFRQKIGVVLVLPLPACRPGSFVCRNSMESHAPAPGTRHV